MSRELPKDVEASSKIARIGAVFGQHREVFLGLSTSTDVQVQGRKVNCCVWLAIWGPLGCGILEAVKGASGYSDSPAACLRVDFDGPVRVTLWSHVARKNDVCFIFCLCGAAAKDEDVEGGGLDFWNVVIFDAGICATQLLHPRIKGGIVDGIP